jgi:hypothetical protein
MRQLICAVTLITVLLGPLTQLAYSEVKGDERFDQVTKRIDGLESRIQRTGTAIILFLFAAFCALWAQNTNRSAVLWFFLGWFFHVIAVVVLLAKNSDDRREARGDPPLNQAWVIGAVIIALLLVAALAMWLFQHQW